MLWLTCACSEIFTIGKNAEVSVKKVMCKMALYKQDIKFFIEFLKKNKIYAEIIGAELKILHQTITDFNKECNSSIGEELVFILKKSLKI